jgi:hypothetical protein
MEMALYKYLDYYYYIFNLINHIFPMTFQKHMLIFIGGQLTTILNSGRKFGTSLISYILNHLIR